VYAHSLICISHRTYDIEYCSLFLSFLNPLNDFNETWYKESSHGKCAYYKGSCVQLLLNFFFEKYFFFAIFPKPSVQCAGVHIKERMLFPSVERNYCIGSSRGVDLSCTI
jgi:hypothetical protein